MSLEPIQIALKRAVVELQSIGAIHQPILPPNQEKACCLDTPRGTTASSVEPPGLSQLWSRRLIPVLGWVLDSKMTSDQFGSFAWPAGPPPLRFLEAPSHSPSPLPHFS